MNLLNYIEETNLCNFLSLVFFCNNITIIINIFNKSVLEKSIMLIKSTVSLKYKVFISALITGGINLPVNFLVW